MCAKERNSKKRKLLAALLSATALLVGCGGPNIRKPRETGVVHVPEKLGRQVYFAFNDPKDDDKGTGRYQYPLKFNNREGYLDITRFTVEDGGQNVIFTITCRRPIPRRREDGSTEPKGWWLQLMDIYIDKDHKKDSGYTRSLPGRHVTFAKESAWENVVLLTPNHSRTVQKMLEERTSDMDLVHMRRKIVIPHRAYAQGYTFVAYVPKFEIGTPQPHWGYQVLMSGYREENLAYGQFQNEEVVKFAGQDHFGGGSDYKGDPNVIDMLAASAQEQYKILSNHVSAPYSGDDRWATVKCIYGGSPVKPIITPQKVVSPGVKLETPADKYLAEQSEWQNPKAKPETPAYVPSVVSRPAAVPHEALRKPTPKPVEKVQPKVDPIDGKVHSFEGGF